MAENKSELLPGGLRPLEGLNTIQDIQQELNKVNYMQQTGAQRKEAPEISANQLNAASKALQEKLKLTKENIEAQSPNSVRSSREVTGGSALMGGVSTTPTLSVLG